MAITHGTTTRGTLAQAVLDAVNGGSAAGKLKILTSGDAVLCTITLQDPAHTRSGAVLTLAGVPLSGTASGTGTAAKFTVTDSNDNIIYQGSVGTGGSDLTIDNTSIASGQTVQVTSHTYTAAV
jgi:hypothetical protein